MIRYEQKIVATTGPTRVSLAPEIEALDDGHPVKRFVALMVLYARDVSTGALPGPYTDQEAEFYARGALIDDEAFARQAAADDGSLAEIFGVPIEQVAAKRTDPRRR